MATSEGYEIAYTGGLGADLKGYLTVWLAAGSNPITSAEWPTYTPPPGYGLNTPRATVFNTLDVIGSPFVPTGQMTYLTTSDGYTWESVAALQRSIYPYIPLSVNGQVLSPQQLAYSISTPPPGVLLVDSNDKNHVNTYYGINGSHANEAHLNYFVSDPWGNTYILKSTNSIYGSPELYGTAFQKAVLPEGWSKLPAKYFSQDVTFYSSYSGEGNSIAHANEFRDSADSAWQQISWGSSGITLNAVSAGGLPIWAGRDGGLLMGSKNSDVIYGAQGNDLIFGGQGDDKIDGGMGVNLAKYTGLRSNYEVTSYNGEVHVQDLKGNDGNDVLVRIQGLNFLDGTLWL